MKNQIVMDFEFKALAAKVDRAVNLMKTLAPSGAMLAYSGGKDSDTLKALARRAGISCSVVYHVTTIDPPEVVRHCRENGAFMDHPGTSYFKEIEKDGLPTRWRRWCCDRLKHGRKNDFKITLLGVRAAESAARRERWHEITLDKKRGAIICPIVNWSDWDVWTFLDAEQVKTCSLYQEGFKRLGCIGCPLSRGSRIKEFPRWPGVAKQVEKSFRAYCYTKTDKIKKEVDFFWDNWINDVHLLKEPDTSCYHKLDLWS